MPRAHLFKVLLEQNRTVWLLILALALCCLAVYVVQDQFVDPELEHFRARQLTLQQELRQKHEQVTKEGVPLSAAARIDEDLQKFLEMIPPKSKLADFVGDLFIWADRSELEIRQITYQPKPDSEMGLLKYGMNFSVEGDYRQLKKFIHLLENSVRILFVDRIALAGGKTDAAGDRIINMQIQLTTFFQEEQ